MKQARHDVSVQYVGCNRVFISALGTCFSAGHYGHQYENTSLCAGADETTASLRLLTTAASPSEVEAILRPIFKQ